jgi:predicted ATPase
LANAYDLTGIDVSAVAEAQSYFQGAIEIARKQSAKSWELRATMSLARLLNKQDKRDEARAMLAEVYGWFTEGFDTADLKDAKALLEELSSWNARKKAPPAWLEQAASCASGCCGLGDH